jgi:hypothetical protein
MSKLMSKEKLKQLAYLGGKLLGVFGLLFVLYKLYHEYTLTGFLESIHTILSLLPLLILLNILSTLLGIKAWHHLLTLYAKQPIAFLLAYYYFAKTEISKYLPGNIFHMVSRQMIASKIELTQKQMGHIQFLLFFTLILGTVVSSTLFALFSNQITHLILLLLIGGSLASIGLLFVLYKSIAPLQKLKTLLLLTIGITLQGVMVGAIIYTQMETLSLELFFIIISVYILSWLIGFVTPGASGGLGVREATFISIISYLHLEVSATAIIFAVVLARFINILVDILFYLSTYGLKVETKEGT